MEKKNHNQKKKAEEITDSAQEPVVEYGNRIKVTSLQELDNEAMFHTLHFTPEQRMEYLFKLRSITHGTNLSEAEKKFHSSRIRINKSNENS